MNLNRWIVPLTLLMGLFLGASAQAAPPEKPARPEALSQAQAIQQPLGQLVTVEFRVGTTTMGRYNEPQATESRLVFLSPDTAMADGNRFQAILTGKAVTDLDRLDLLGDDRPDKFFDGKLVRVTGKLETLGPEVARTFRVTVRDLEGFEVVRLRLK